MSVDVANSPPTSAPPRPSWFRRPSAPPGRVIAVEETGESLSWKKRVWRRVFGYSTFGYLISLLLHTGSLAVMSLILFHDGREGAFTIAGVVDDSDEVIEIVDEPLDTKMEEPAAPLIRPQSISIEAVDVSNIAIPELNLPDSHQPLLGGDGAGIGAGEGGGAAVGVPASAISKGSFTVWTEPEDPKPREAYFIYIQVKLPKATRRYRQSDLSGMVIGTDGYRLRLPPQPREYLRLIEHHARLKIFVPGAAALVKDIIQVRSRILDEEQTIELEF